MRSEKKNSTKRTFFSCAKYITKVIILPLSAKLAPLNRQKRWEKRKNEEKIKKIRKKVWKSFARFKNSSTFAHVKRQQLQQTVS